jgi:hypothetical protein
MRRRRLAKFSCLGFLILSVVVSDRAQAQTVWTGFEFSFTKPNNTADPQLPENQDRITDNVWITRNANQGIFNINIEDGYFGDSPSDTEWATDINNPSDTIAATNWANLDFDSWINAYGGPGSLALLERLTSRNAVVHLITDDIYLDLRFTDWGVQCCGGFSYERSLAPDIPGPTGDYNNDGAIDAADYVVWRKMLNLPAVPPGTGADGDESGTVDAGDYTFWRQHYGDDLTGSGGASPAPEPSSVAIAVLGLAVTQLSARRSAAKRMVSTAEPSRIYL